MRWYKFKDVMPKGGGFYVLRYRGYRDDPRPDRPVYMDARGERDSYWVVSENMGKVTHDLGHCIWPVSWSASYQPTEWRNMGAMEALRFSRKLYRFGREYLFGTEVRSRGALTASDPIIYNRG